MRKIIKSNIYAATETNTIPDFDVNALAQEVSKLLGTSVTFTYKIGRGGVPYFTSSDFTNATGVLAGKLFDKMVIDTMASWAPSEERPEWSGILHFQYHHPTGGSNGNNFAYFEFDENGDLISVSPKY